MDEGRYDAAGRLIIEVRESLVPWALRPESLCVKERPAERLGDPLDRLRRRVLGMRTSEQLRYFLHSRASLATWQALDSALLTLSRELHQGGAMRRAMLREGKHVQPDRLLETLLAHPTSIGVVQLALDPKR